MARYNIRDVVVLYGVEDIPAKYCLADWYPIGVMDSKSSYPVQLWICRHKDYRPVGGVCEKPFQFTADIAAHSGVCFFVYIWNVCPRR